MQNCKVKPTDGIGDNKVFCATAINDRQMSTIRTK